LWQWHTAHICQAILPETTFLWPLIDTSPLATYHSVMELAAPTTAEREAWRKLTTLAEIGRIFTAAATISPALHQALELLGEFHGLVRSFVMLADENGATMRVTASYCLNATAKRGMYSIGEGVVGQVAASGKPVIVPQVSLEPTLADALHTSPHELEMSFICVPLTVGRKVLGVLGVELFYQ
jgi:Nif-specific regulatory protein